MGLTLSWEHPEDWTTSYPPGSSVCPQVRFLVLDECDGLLSAGYTDFINRIHNQIPQVISDGKRLQLLSEAIKILKGE
ncbi:hypothetical protein KUCAC02_019558 [Chaenocephalus aceratus]|uniref:Uncharacterized protein n=1 Tax=Chaenocephalus aceratus TaxID=36190 RepID=A0ACB9VNQ5_CHAAC|nr:hypothetical protein KUCAC02_019558 [Chaenocephalus aceratus]